MRQLLRILIQLVLFGGLIAVPGTVTAQESGEERQSQRNVKGRQPSRRGGGSRLGNYTVPPPAAKEFPVHLFDLMLGRPTDRSVTVCVLTYDEVEGYFEYGTESGRYTGKTDSIRIQGTEPVDVLISPLAANTRYYYRWNFRTSGASNFQRGDEFTFHTQRAVGETFTFTVQSDSHLDENTMPDVYLRTLANALGDGPDFHFGLGDTFMTGKYVRPELSHRQYLAQRYYLGHLCHSAAFFFALGNHDGESGGRGSQVWATQTRLSLFPNPVPNHFYSGNERNEAGIGLPENYYQFEWGNGQFIVLDPFRYTARRRGGDGDNWHWSLGETQYRWLKSSLEQSDAKFRFVFLHHLVGGSDRNSRGGIEAAPFYEWGGQSADGEYDFDRKRPGWGKPIHEMLAEHGASIVFHGHDHLYVQQQLDGIVYQLVPQPGHARFGNTRSAREYGYVNGVVQSSSGHVRVRVSADDVRVDYVRTYLPQSESADRQNGDVSHSYLISGRKDNKDE
jgi:hypothetical protein